MVMIILARVQTAVTVGLKVAVASLSSSWHTVGWWNNGMLSFAAG
jgi:hypothetical protein